MRTNVRYTDPVTFPVALGRGVIINAGAEPPEGWLGAPRVVIDDAAVVAPGHVVAQLHAAWVARQPVVLELIADAASFREPRSYRLDPWEAGARFEPIHDRLHFLVWANNVDARGADPIWWWGRKAERLGAAPCADGSGDAVLPDGRPVWIDGGPRGPLPPEVGLVVHSETVELLRLTVTPPEQPLEADLAADQRAAVGHGSGAARVIAPAGSGKTRVLTERLRLLHTKRAYERETTLAVAYNVKARAEMETRCADFRPQVKTLNAYGQSLLNASLGRLNVLDEREVRRIVEGLVEIPQSRRRANTDPLTPYLEALSLCRLGLQNPRDTESSRDDVPGFAGVFIRYRDALAQRAAVDFDEQIYRTIEVLLSNGAFRAEAQRSCRHLLVDEFQDLTPAHVLMLRLLSIPTLDCFGVGDDDQVIYGHVGADPQFLIQFDSLFPGAAEYALQVNYRSAAPIVTAARALLGYNQRRIVKDIRPAEDASTDPSAFRVALIPTETLTGKAVEQIQAWIAAGSPHAQIALLTRVNSQLLAPQVALTQRGVPVNGALDERILERTGLRAALAYLRLAVGTGPAGGYASADVVEILRRPSRGLPQWFPDRLRRKKAWSASELRSIGSTMTDRETDKLDAFVDDLESLRRVARGSNTVTILRAVRADIGLDGAMELLDRSAGSEGSSHLDDLDALLQVAALEPDPARFEPWLRESLAKRPAAEASPDGGAIPVVTLSTVHRVKGLEWNHVIVFGVNAGVFPHRLSEDDEEERRVLHVGITRGRINTVVLADASRPSMMVPELDGSAPTRSAVSTGAISRAAVRQGPAAGGSGVSGQTALAAEDEPLFDALRTWRTSRAKADKVPPYIVMSDQTLRAICAKKPSSLVAMTRVPGIGPTKLDNYGEEILEVLRGAGVRVE